MFSAIVPLHFPASDKIFYFFDPFCHLALWQCFQNITPIPAFLCCPVIQNGHNAGVLLRADCPAESLPQLLLHIRDYDGLDIGFQGSVLLLLCFMDGVRNRKWQFYDDERRYHVPRKVHTFPAGAGCEQHPILHSLKTEDFFLRMPPTSTMGNGKLSLKIWYTLPISV